MHVTQAEKYISKRLSYIILWQDGLLFPLSLCVWGWVGEGEAGRIQLYRELFVPSLGELEARFSFVDLWTNMWSSLRHLLPLSQIIVGRTKITCLNLGFCPSLIRGIPNSALLSNPRKPNCSTWEKPQQHL